MSNRTRPGHITLTLEMPIEVADWLSANAERLGNELRIASVKARHTEEQTQKNEQERSNDRRTYLIDLGRTGYRQLRRAGVTKYLAKNRDVIGDVADELGVSSQVLEIAVTRFKRNLDKELQKRRSREIGRLYWAGFGNQEIAARLHIHPNTVANHIQKVIKPTGRRA